jgi:hypothetical protein
VQKLRWPDGRVVMAFRAIPQVPPHTKIGETVQGGRVVHVVQGVGLQTTKKAKYLFSSFSIPVKSCRGLINHVPSYYWKYHFLIDIILKFHCLYSPALGFYSKYNPSLISNIS